MAENSLLIFLLVGAIAGWLAGVLVRGYGFGLVGNVIVGVAGSFIGGWLFTHFHVMHGGNALVDDAIGATFGAVVLLVLLRLVRRVA